MKEWWKDFESKLKENSFFFMSFLTGTIIWAALSSPESELAIKYHYLFGVCCAWLIVSLVGIRLSPGKKPSDHQAT